MTDYLYPMSSVSDTVLLDHNGDQTPNVAYNYFVEGVIHRSLGGDWLLRGSYRQIVDGDRLWLYYGKADFDLGIVGVADIVSDPYQRAGGEWAVKIVVDFDATANLIRQPVLADYVRTYFPYPRNVCRMDPHPKLVHRCEQRAGLRK